MTEEDRRSMGDVSAEAVTTGDGGGAGKVAAAGASGLTPVAAKSVDGAAGWLRVLIFLGVLVVGMGLAMVACAVFPATAPGPRQAKAGSAEGRHTLASLGLLRSDMPALHGWRYIIIHDSADEGASFEAIEREHRRRGRDGMGFHFVIGDGDTIEDGAIVPTDIWWQQAAGEHFRDQDAAIELASGGVSAGAASADVDRQVLKLQGLGIVLLGDLENEPPSAAQLDSLVDLTVALARRLNIPMSNILLESELGSGQRPLRGFPAADFLRRVADGRMSTRRG